MRIVKISQQNMNTAISEASKVLKNGGVIAIPTETTYGLACDPRNEQAVKKIFQIKGRVETKPLQLIAASMAQVLNVGILNEFTTHAARKYWPGPLTLLIPILNKMSLAKQVSPKCIIGIRISSYILARKIAEVFDFPIAATSANRSGNMPAFSGRGVVKAFSGFTYQPDLVLDVGSIPHHVPTTVAMIQPDGAIEVLRRGRIMPRV